MMKDDPIVQREGAGMKAAMNVSFDVHPDEAPCQVPIDTLTPMAAV